MAEQQSLPARPTIKQSAEFLNVSREDGASARGVTRLPCRPPGNPGGSSTTKKVGRWNPPSPLTVPADTYKGLFEAASKRLPSCRVEFGGKDGLSEATVKSPFAESAFASGGLPPVLMPQLTQGLL